MKHLLTILFAAILACAGSAHGQTVKALAYNTNGQVIYGATNAMTFTNAVTFSDQIRVVTGTVSIPSVRISTNLGTGLYYGSALGVGPFIGFAISSNAITRIATNRVLFDQPIDFSNVTNSTASRTNLGLGSAWLTNTNVSTFRSDIGLPLAALTNTNVSNFKNALDLGSFRSPNGYAALYWENSEYLNVEDGVNVLFPIYWSGTNGIQDAAITRTNLGIGLPALTNTSNVTIIQALSGAAAAAYNGTIIFANIQGIVVSNGIIVDIEE